MAKALTLSDFCKNPTDTPEGLAQHEACRGRVYIWPPRNGKVTIPCECTHCKHPAVWRGRPPAHRPGSAKQRRTKGARGGDIAQATGGSSAT